LGPFLREHADGPLEARDAPGNFLKYLVGKTRVLAEIISGRFDVGNLESYVVCNDYFTALGV
jgi:hypothetical protein